MVKSIRSWWRADHGPQVRERTARQWFSFAGIALVFALVATSVEPLLVTSSLRLGSQSGVITNGVFDILAYLGAGVILIAYPALLFTTALGVICRMRSPRHLSLIHI